MLRIVLVGLLILLGVGVLTAMELKTPPRAVVPIAQQATVGSSDLSGTLAKDDRLEITYPKDNPITETEPGPIDERIPPLVAPTTGTPSLDLLAFQGGATAPSLDRLIQS